VTYGIRAAIEENSKTFRFLVVEQDDILNPEGLHLLTDETAGTRIRVPRMRSIRSESLMCALAAEISFAFKPFANYEVSQRN
jgi:hypothetical protein